MKYLLVVGFLCDVYRREPTARIFVGDRLIDEFNIPHTTNNLYTSKQEFRKKLHPLQPFLSTEINNFRIKNLPHLKFYELQIDNKISDLEIRIDICNSDSNYNNGYMTRSTMIILDVCSFFPLQRRLLRRLQKIRDKGRISENLAWYYLWKNHLFDLVVNGVSWKAANGQKIIETTSSIGGDGQYVCHLAKKYGILMTTLARAWRHSFDPVIMNYYFDKYLLSCASTK